MTPGTLVGNIFFLPFCLLLSSLLLLSGRKWLFFLSLKVGVVLLLSFFTFSLVLISLTYVCGVHKDAGQPGIPSLFSLFQSQNSEIKKKVVPLHRLLVVL